MSRPLKRAAVPGPTAPNKRRNAPAPATRTKVVDFCNLTMPFFGVKLFLHDDHFFTGNICPEKILSPLERKEVLHTVPMRDLLRRIAFKGNSSLTFEHAPYVSPAGAYTFSMSLCFTVNPELVKSTVIYEEQVGYTVMESRLIVGLVNGLASLLNESKCFQDRWLQNQNCCNRVADYVACLFKYMELQKGKMGVQFEAGPWAKAIWLRMEIMLASELPLLLCDNRRCPFDTKIKSPAGPTPKLDQKPKEKEQEPARSPSAISAPSLHAGSDVSSNSVPPTAVEQSQEAIPSPFIGQIPFLGAANFSWPITIGQKVKVARLSVSLCKDEDAIRVCEFLDCVGGQVNCPFEIKAVASAESGACKLVVCLEDFREILFVEKELDCSSITAEAKARSFCATLEGELVRRLFSALNERLYTQCEAVNVQLAGSKETLLSDARSVAVLLNDVKVFQSKGRSRSPSVDKKRYPWEWRSYKIACNEHWQAYTQCQQAGQGTEKETGAKGSAGGRVG